MKLLFIADIVGQTGIDLISRMLPSLVKQYRVDIVVANGENSDDGRGLMPDQVRLFSDLGVDVITSGNHIWDKAPLRKEMRQFNNLLRPLNYPPGSGGRGSIVIQTRLKIPVAVINLQGRTFMPPIDCPFRTADREIKNIKDRARIIFIDMHAESTAEKQALAWHLDGTVSAVIGTHTHVQTADERILPKGTGYLTDAGMTGAMDSVIGMATKVAIHRFITQTPQPYQLARDNLRFNGVLLEFNADNGHCVKIERLNLP